MNFDLYVIHKVSNGLCTRDKVFPLGKNERNLSKAIKK